MSRNSVINTESKPVIYINFANKKIKGPVVEKNHKDWVELSSLTMGIKRHLHTQTGHVANREMSKPEFSSFNAKKPLDSTGPLIAQEACSGKCLDNVVIHFCKTGSSGLVLLQEITLKDVYVSSFSLNTNPNDFNEMETFDLNYSHIEIKGYGYDATGKQTTPHTFGYDLAQAALA